MVLILYEKLPDLVCFACGRIGHLLKDCSETLDRNTSLQYGPWLRAGRGIEYRRTTHPSNNAPRTSFTKLAAKENPLGPKPPLRGDVGTKAMTTAIQRKGGTDMVNFTGVGTEGMDIMDSTTESNEAQVEVIKIPDKDVMLLDGPDGGEDRKKRYQGVMERTGGKGNNILLGRMVDVGKETERGDVGKSDEEEGRGQMRGVDRTGDGRKDFNQKEKCKEKERDNRNPQKKLSPNKTKRNMRRKGWKRLAREPYVEGHALSNKEMGKGEVLLGKRSCDDGGQGEEENRESKRMMVAGDHLRTSQESTAEAAEQPRRSL